MYRIPIAILLFILPAGTIWAGWWLYKTRKASKNEENTTNDNKSDTEKQ